MTFQIIFMRLKRSFLCVKQSKNHWVLNVITLRPFKSFKDFHINFMVYLNAIIIHYAYSSISSIARLKQVSSHSAYISPFNNFRTSAKILYALGLEPYFISYGYTFTQWFICTSTDIYFDLWTICSKASLF